MKKSRKLLVSSLMLSGLFLTACGEKVPTMYDVKFMNGEEVFFSTSVEEGKLVSAPSTNPTKGENEVGGKYYTYTFDKWMNGDEAFSFDTPVSDDLTLDASYLSQKVTCKVTFNNNGAKLDEQTVDKGDYATYGGETPTKAADNVNKAYSFANWMNGSTVWDLANNKVMSDLTLEASFTGTPRADLKVYLVDSDGTTSLGEIDVKEGLTATKPTDPTKNLTAQYTYTFSKWLNGTSEFDWSTPINSNTTLKAEWIETINKYDVVFKNGETEVKKMSQVEYGTDITAPQDDLSYDEDGYHYDFLGWALENTTTVIESFGKVQGDATYVPVFDDAETITYTATVHFNYDNAPEDEEIEYTVENRETKIAEMTALLPEENFEYEYAFEDSIEELPLEDATYNINKIYKGIDEDFTGLTNLPDSLKFRKCSADEETFPGVSVDNGSLKLNVNADSLYTSRSYKNFEMEFKVKSLTSINRLSVTLGVSDEAIADTERSFVVENKLELPSIQITNESAKWARFYPTGSAADFSTSQQTSGTDFQNNYMQVKIRVSTGKVKVFLDGTEYLDTSSSWTVPTDLEGHILISRGRGEPEYSETSYEIDDFKLQPLDIEKVVNFYVDNTLYSSQNVAIGGLVEEPAEPSKDNDGEYKFVFKHWELNNVEFNFATPITSDIDLYAKFDRVIDDGSFDANFTGTATYNYSNEKINNYLSLNTRGDVTTTASMSNGALTVNLMNGNLPLSKKYTNFELTAVVKNTSIARLAMAIGSVDYTKFIADYGSVTGSIYFCITDSWVRYREDGTEIIGSDPITSGMSKTDFATLKVKILNKQLTVSVNGTAILERSLSNSFVQPSDIVFIKGSGDPHTYVFDSLSLTVLDE